MIRYVTEEDTFCFIRVHFHFGQTPVCMKRGVTGEGNYFSFFPHALKTFREYNVTLKYGECSPVNVKRQVGDRGSLGRKATVEKKVIFCVSCSNSWLHVDGTS